VASENGKYNGDPANQRLEIEFWLWENSASGRSSRWDVPAMFSDQGGGLHHPVLRSEAPAI